MFPVRGNEADFTPPHDKSTLQKAPGSSVPYLEKPQRQQQQQQKNDSSSLFRKLFANHRNFKSAQMDLSELRGHPKIERVIHGAFGSEIFLWHIQWNPVHTFFAGPGLHMGRALAPD